MVLICLPVVEEVSGSPGLTSHQLQALVLQAWIELLVTDIDTILGVIEFHTKKKKCVANWQMKDVCGAGQNKWIHCRWLGISDLCGQSADWSFKTIWQWR